MDTNHQELPDYWPHAPKHVLSKNGTYFVTAATYHKSHFFVHPQRLDVLQRGLLKLANQYGWQLEAWCILSNHYHFIAQSPPDGGETLSTLISMLHSKTGRWVNQLDQTPGRRVWDNYWDLRLLYQRSYLARLHYTHANAVHHGLAEKPSDYPWCSASWFEQYGTASIVKTVYSMPISKLNEMDNYWF